MACFNTQVSPASLLGKVALGKFARLPSWGFTGRKEDIPAAAQGWRGSKRLWPCRDTRLPPSPIQTARGNSMISAARTGSRVLVSGFRLPTTWRMGENSPSAAAARAGAVQRESPHQSSRCVAVP